MAGQFKGVINQLNKTAAIMKLKHDELEILRKPDRVIEVSLPVLMDDGHIKVFDGYRVQYNNIRGPYKDVPAPDVYTNPQIMAWLMDEYSHIRGENTPAAVTGKPVEIGGSLGRDTATSLGGFFVFERVLEKLKTKKRDIGIAVQGFGNVGMNFAIIAHKAGYKIAAVSDSRGGIYNAKGLKLEAVLAHKQATGSVINFKGATDITNEKLLELPVEVLAPAALENVINKKNVGRIKAKIILELANGPTAPEAEAKLLKKGVLVVPDVLVNAGGVIVSYFEWVQNLRHYYWEQAKVEANLKKQLASAFNKVWQTMAAQGNKEMRTAAYMVAVERIVKALKARGI